MLDDSKSIDVAGDNNIRMIEEIVQIKKCQVPRKPSQKWARNLRLLAFDPGVSDKNEPDEAPWETGSSSVVGCRYDALEYFSAFPHECDRWNRQSCTTCRGFPEFPANGRVKDLRLVSPKAPKGDQWATGNCSHYCSVSYCWSNNETTEGSYNVRCEDGTIRPNRAPDAVLRRAIAFAIQNQTRFIWIDQECVDQDDVHDKELAIQSMDVVYQRARFSVGIFNNTIASQKHVEALQALLSWGDDGCKSDLSHLVDHTSRILDVMESLATDRWNTRGWILQENFSAGMSMRLLIPLEGRCDVGRGVLLKNIHLSSDVAIDSETLSRCTSYMRSYSSYLSKQGHADHLVRRAQTVDKLLTWLHPDGMVMNDADCGSHVNRERRTCSAAIALALLRYRDLGRVSDKLAIIANLCDWDVRLNTAAVEKHHPSLNLCVFTLAIMNGDLSLLTPESYGDQASFSSGDATGIISSIEMAVRHMPALSVSSYEPQAISVGRILTDHRAPQISHAGLSLLGRLWKVHGSIDMSRIKERYGSQWIALESPTREEDLEAEAGHSEIIGLSPKRYELVCDILWDIMTTLLDNGLDRLADAVWQSTRKPVDHVRLSGARPARAYQQDSNDRLYILDSFVKMQEKVPQNKTVVFALDQARDGTFHQEWIIKRVMQYGRLCYASSVRESLDEIQDPSPKVSFPSKHRPISDNILNEVKSQMVMRAPGNPDALWDKMRTNTVDVSGTSDAQEIDIQLSTALLSMYVDMTMDRSDADAKDYRLMDPASLAQFGLAARLLDSSQSTARQGNVDSDTSGLPSDTYLALFDVDGPALVLTPCDERREKLPRPQYRSMSCSWLLQNTKPFAQDTSITESFETIESVKGMWENLPEAIVRQERYNLVFPYSSRALLGTDDTGNTSAINPPEVVPGKKETTAKASLSESRNDHKKSPAQGTPDTASVGGGSACSIPESENSDTSSSEGTTSKVSDSTSRSSSPLPPPQNVAQPRRRGKSAHPVSSKKTPSSSKKMKFGLKQITKKFDDNGHSYFVKHKEEVVDKINAAEWFEKYTLCIVHQMDFRNTDIIRSYLQINASAIKKVIREVVGAFHRSSLEAGQISIELPARPLFHWRHELRKAFARLSGEDAKHGKILLDFLADEFKDVEEEGSNLCKAGLITYEHLWTLFKPGTTILTSAFGQPVARKVQTYEYLQGQQPCFSICASGTDYDGEDFGVDLRRVQIGAFEGSYPIASLSACPIGFHARSKTATREALIARGRIFESLAGQNLRHYDGIAIDDGGQAPVPFSVNARVMIDCKTYKRLDPGGAQQVRPWMGRRRRGGHQRHDEWMYARGSDSDDEELEKFDKKGMTDEQCLLASPVVRGFSFADKKWFLFNVDKLTMIDWNAKCFDQLVLAPEQKTMVKALVTRHAQDRLQFDDIVKGKGKGLIMVLHGAPGVGKTLTAECVAEYTKKALYQISSGDLGTDSETLDRRLSRAFELAATWKAVLLIDEADVFLERRSLHDLQRNGLVSIFLRVLEYYQGILFLTTNRIDTFDEAFKSRIHMPLKYGELPQESRKKIWANFLEPLKAEKDLIIDEAGYDQISAPPLNGRQIKNVIRTAIDLAEFNGKKLSVEQFDQVIKIQLEFDRELST